MKGQGKFGLGCDQMIWIAMRQCCPTELIYTEPGARICADIYSTTEIKNSGLFPLFLTFDLKLSFLFFTIYCILYNPQSLFATYHCTLNKSGMHVCINVV